MCIRDRFHSVLAVVLVVLSFRMVSGGRAMNQQERVGMCHNKTKAGGIHSTEGVTRDVYKRQLFTHLTSR